ncbi:MAG: methyltransferase [Candidatus Geothermarchaeales archaeon]
MIPSGVIAGLFCGVVVLTGTLLILAFKKKVRKNRSIGWSLSLLYWLWSGYLIFGAIIVENAFHPLPRFSQPSQWWLGGIILEIIGIAIAGWGMLELSFPTTSALKQDRLVKTGPYKYCRNPQHLGIFILFLGLSLMYNSLFILILSITLIAWSYFQIRAEETWLLRLFGEEFEEYMESVPRYLPRPKRLLRMGNPWLTPRLNKAGKAVKEFLFGLLVFEIYQYHLSKWITYKDVFMLMALGEMLGIPMLPPYYSLRVFPYFVPNIEPWRRRLLRERDIF